ncbi:hypothetical protein BD770DRAFT_390092 [Pilaira anomala]|nr:hypothetical protein BD770DRAFT_390092 [Pilaira anomala]
MSIYNHEQQEESPWAILDPSLKQHSFSIEPLTFGPAYIEHYVPLTQLHSIEEEQEQEQEQEEVKEKKPETVEEWFLRNCTRETNEIESELLHHRNSIYSEKLNVLLRELDSIEKETHKEIIKSDKKASRKRDKELATIEAMYNYQLQMVDKQVEDEKAKILEDIKQKTDFARRVIISEGSLNNGIVTKKRKEISPSSHSETEEVEPELQSNYCFKKIHLKKKIGKLQAISDRQRASKKSLEDALNIVDHEELDLDMAMMKKSICGD